MAFEAVLHKNERGLSEPPRTFRDPSQSGTRTAINLLGRSKGLERLDRFFIGATQSY
jgi:hypothetical protein